MEKSLLSFANPPDCPLSCLPTPVPPVSVSTDNGTTLHLTSFTDASLLFNKTSLSNAWGWNSVSYDGSKTAYLGKVICEFA